MFIGAISVWPLLLVIAVTVGISRTRLLGCRLDDQTAHVIGTFIVVATFAFVIWLVVPWIDSSLNPTRLV